MGDMGRAGLPEDKQESPRWLMMPESQEETRHLSAVQCEGSSRWVPSSVTLTQDDPWHLWVPVPPQEKGL